LPGILARSLAASLHSAAALYFKCWDKLVTVGNV